MSTTPKNAALYVRISDDRAGDAAGVGRQEADARKLAERLGWEVGETYAENDVSAFKRRRMVLPDGTTAMRVVRPEFRRLLDDIGNGVVDGFIAYHLDRVARDPRDLEDLIDAVERTRVPVESVTGSIRLATDADVTMARIGVAIANQSSRDSSRRIRRKHEELATQGRYAGGGTRRYGYEVDGITIREDEAAVLREAAQRVLAGEAVSAICRDLDAQGIRPVKAKRWSSKTLGDQLRGGRIAGLRVHRGEIVGDAQWPAILDRNTWDAVVAELSRRGQGKVKRELTHWLSEVLFCGRCGHPMTAAYVSSGRWRYWCSSYRDSGGCGRVAIAGEPTEDEITQQILAYLTRPDVVAELTRATSTRSIEDARKDMAEDEVQLKVLARMWAEKKVTLEEYAEARQVIEERLNAARTIVRQHVPRGVRVVIESKDPPKAWEKLTPINRRELIRAVLAPAGYKGWTVAPADPMKPRKYDPSRLSLARMDVPASDE